MVKRLLFLPVVLIVLLACSFIPSNTSPPVVGEPQIPSSQIPRASLSEAKSAFDRSTAVFVDVRALSSYQAGHIPGALSIPVDEIEGRLGELDPAQWIITYCT